jgi:riboflavin synthase alpha subunit
LTRSLNYKKFIENFNEETRKDVAAWRKKRKWEVDVKIGKHIATDGSCATV